MKTEFRNWRKLARFLGCCPDGLNKFWNVTALRTFPEWDEIEAAYNYLSEYQKMEYEWFYDIVRDFKDFHYRINPHSRGRWQFYAGFTFGGWDFLAIKFTALKGTFGFQLGRGYPFYTRKLVDAGFYWTKMRRGFDVACLFLPFRDFRLEHSRFSGMHLMVNKNTEWCFPDDRGWPRLTRDGIKFGLPENANLDEEFERRVYGDG